MVGLFQRQSNWQTLQFLPWSPGSWFGRVKIQPFWLWRSSLRAQTERSSLQTKFRLCRYWINYVHKTNVCIPVTIPNVLQTVETLNDDEPMTSSWWAHCKFMTIATRGQKGKKNICGAISQITSSSEKSWISTGRKAQGVKRGNSCATVKTIKVKSWGYNAFKKKVGRIYTL